MPSPLVYSELRRGDMKTSENALELGLYASGCCNSELIFAQGDCMSRCPSCERLCKWELSENLVSWLDLEQQVQELAA
jgi:hypothetical protein